MNTSTFLFFTSIITTCTLINIETQAQSSNNDNFGLDFCEIPTLKKRGAQLSIEEYIATIPFSYNGLYYDPLKSVYRLKNVQVDSLQNEFVKLKTCIQTNFEDRGDSYVNELYELSSKAHEHNHEQFLKKYPYSQWLMEKNIDLRMLMEGMAEDAALKQVLRKIITEDSYRLALLKYFDYEIVKPRDLAEKVVVQTSAIGGLPSGYTYAEAYKNYRANRYNTRTLYKKQLEILREKFKKDIELEEFNVKPGSEQGRATYHLEPLKRRDASKVVFQSSKVHTPATGGPAEFKRLALQMQKIFKHSLETFKSVQRAPSNATSHISTINTYTDNLKEIKGKMSRLAQAHGASIMSEVKKEKNKEFTVDMTASILSAQMAVQKARNADFEHAVRKYLEAVFSNK